MRNLKLLMTIMSLGLLVAAFVPLAQANVLNERTIVTFKEPVEIPGMVLPAGSYVFHLVDPASERQIVEIQNAKSGELVKLSVDLTAQRSEVNPGPDFIFARTGKTSPMRLKEWFYPGYFQGVQFIYPNKK